MNAIYIDTNLLRVAYQHVGYYPYNYMLLRIIDCNNEYLYVCPIVKNCNTDEVLFLLDISTIKSNTYEVELYYSDGTIDTSPEKFIQKTSLHISRKTC